MKSGNLLDNSWQTQVRRVAHGVRKRVLELTIKNNGCYLSQTLSSADLLATLYMRSLKLGSSEGDFVPGPNPGTPDGGDVRPGQGRVYNGPKGTGYDRLLISPAHYAVAVYATLVETGRLSSQALSSFNTDGSSVEMIGAEHSPGFELTTGSFGQAVSQAGGIALARRLNGETGRCVVFMSDGELEEGQTWEAFQCLAHYGLDNLVVCVDVNGMQCDGATADQTLIEPINSRAKAFGCDVAVVDGHDVEAIDDAINHTDHKAKPLVVLCYTNSAEGVPMLENRKPKLHYVRFGSTDERSEYQEFLKNWEFDQARS